MSVLEETEEHGSTAQVCKVPPEQQQKDFWNNEQMRPKWRYLAIMTSTTFDENQTTQHEHSMTTVKHSAELIVNYYFQGQI